MTYQALLDDRIDLNTSELLCQRLRRFANRYGFYLQLDVDNNEDRPAILWQAIINEIGENDRLYRNAVRTLNRALTGEDSTYWHGLWHDAANPRRPQPMRYL